MNLLITSAGRRNQLIECFRQDAAALGLPLRVLATVESATEPGLSDGGCVIHRAALFGAGLHPGGARNLSA